MNGTTDLAKKKQDVVPHVKGCHFTDVRPTQILSGRSSFPRSGEGEGAVVVAGVATATLRTCAQS